MHTNISCPDFYGWTLGEADVGGDVNPPSYITPQVKPNPDVSGIGVIMPFPFLLQSELVP